MVFRKIYNNIEDIAFENWLALMLCITSRREISIEQALKEGGISARSESRGVENADVRAGV